ncbi:MAG: hypothetical protein E7527_00710 [Ruminococcaceae bacterium]|nr:hypothetical protein [Oscillospiraceae bacterium]
MKARSARKVKKKANWPLRILAIAGVAFLFIQIWRTQDQLSTTEQKNQAIMESINKKTIHIEDLTAQTQGDQSSALEQKAYDAGFCKPGQKVIEEEAG